MRLSRVIAIVSLCSFAACAVEPVDEEVDETSRALVQSELITWNGLEWAAISANYARFQTLMSGRLAANANSAALLDTSPGEELVKKLVVCAMPPDTKIVLPNSLGVRKTFEGAVGLASSWPQMPLTPEQSRWMMGCLIAHENALGLTIPINPRGLHNAYLGREAKAFQTQEAAFWGDRTGEICYACVGIDLDAQCGRSASPTLADRGCSQGDPLCVNIQVVGRCPDVCGSYVNGMWSDCKAPGDPNVYREVSTIYLEGKIPYSCKKL